MNDLPVIAWMLADDRMTEREARQLAEGTTRPERDPGAYGPRPQAAHLIGYNDPAVGRVPVGGS